MKAHSPLNAVVHLAHGHYYLRKTSREIHVPGLEDEDRQIPILLFSSNGGTVTAETIFQEVQRFSRSDDVFSSDFLSHTIVVQSEIDQATTLPTPTWIGEPGHELSWQVWRSFHLPLCADGTSLPSGPYFLYGSRIYEAWRLYADDLDSFQTTLIPDAKNPYRFHPLNAVSPDGHFKAITVPSRLYSQVSSSKPLAGCRIAVKDLFKLLGVKTALNVRAFLELHDAETSTAAYVKLLIDLGAIIVGKTKMTAWAGGERAPEFWIDFHCPFNPRADGYQVPSGSTSGGGACLAGYPFIDFSFGSDTYGSIRWPAAACGLYGLRCTVDQAASMEGIYAQVPLFDTLGVMSRGLPQLQTMAKVSLNTNIQDSAQFPVRLLCPTDWRQEFTLDHNIILDEFASVLEDVMGLQAQYISLSDTWQKTPHSLGQGKTFQEFFHKTGYNIFYHDAYHEWDQFRAEYMKSFGKKPYVGPHVTWLWALGERITSDERKQAERELGIYREWMETNIISNKYGSDMSAIIVLPVLSTKPEYRDVLSPPFSARLGVDTITLGSWLGLPELVLPVTKAAYQSRITDRTEHLPVSISILGPKGSEMMLINLALAALTKAKIPTVLETGTEIFT